MNAPTKEPRRKSPNGVTWAQACRDIVVTSMNRGQLPVLGMLAVALLLIWKMPNEEASKLVFEVVASLRRGEMWGYPALLATLAGWFFHTKSMRKSFSAEAERIGREKSDLQSTLSGVKYKSSNRK